MGAAVGETASPGLQSGEDREAADTVRVTNALALETRDLAGERRARDWWSG
jgi:hypothetical protein